MNLYQEMNDKIADLLLRCEDNAMCLYAGTYIKDLEKQLGECRGLADIVHPEYMGENKGVGCRVGQCRCGNLVRSYHKFCNECGVKLEWGDVWPDEHKAGKSSEQTKRRGYDRRRGNKTPESNESKI